MKNSRIAAQLRSLTLAPSLESDDTASTTETGPGSEGVVKTDVDTDAESPNQTTDETTPAEGKDLSVTTSEVGERSDLESAQTQIKPGEGEPTEVSLEAFSTATKAKIRRFFGGALYTGKLYEKVEKIDEQIRALEEQIAAVEKTKSVSNEGLEGAKWEGVKADMKASWGFMPDPDRPGKTKWRFTGSPMKLAAAKAEQLEELENKKAKLEEKLQALLVANKGKVSTESVVDPDEIPDNSKNVDADRETGPGGEGVVKQTLDTHGESPNQTTEETTPAENKDLTTKTVEVGERGELESAETNSDKDGENVVVSSESLVAAGIIGLAAGFSTWAAGKFVKEVDSIADLQKRIKQAKEDTKKAEQEFVDRAKAVAAAAKAKSPTVSQEADNEKASLGQQLRGAASATITSGIGVVGGFALGGPIGAAIGGLIMAGAWTMDMKRAAKICRDKRAELLALELKLADRQLELATRVAAAEKQYKVSNESLDEFEALSVSTESFKSVIKFIVSKERRLEWSLEQSPKWNAEIDADIADVRERIAAAKKADNPAKVRKLEEELAWYIELKDDAAATDKEFREELARIRAKKAAAQKVVSTEAFDDAAAAAAAAFAEGAAGAAEAAAAATGGDAGEVTEHVTEVAETVAETVAADVAEDAGADAGAEAGEAAAEGDVEDVSDDELAAGEAELNELDGSIEEAEGHAEEYEQAAATMESLIDALRSAQLSGGLTPQSAQFATITFESVGIRLTGAPFQNAHGESAMPSLESFGGTMRRDQATSISLENAGQWFAKIWEVLKNTWAQISAWIANFIKVLFSQGERYKQRALKIQQLSKGNLPQPKNRTVKAGAAGAKIAVGDKLDVNNMSLLLNFATAVKGTMNSTEDGEANLVAYVNSFDQAKIDGYKNAQAGEPTFGAMGPFKNPQDVDGKSGFATDVMPGNYRLVIVPSEANAVVAKIASVLGRNAGPTRVIKRVQEEGGAGEDATMNLWLGPQIGSVCTHVIKTLDIVAQMRPVWEKAASLKLTHSGSADFSEEDQAVVKEIINATQRRSREEAAAIKAIGQALVATSGHYLDVCAVHLKEYGVNVGLADKAVAGVKDAAAKAGEATSNAAGAAKDAAGKAAGAVKDAAGNAAAAVKGAVSKPATAA